MIGAGRGLKLSAGTEDLYMSQGRLFLAASLSLFLWLEGAAQDAPSPPPTNPAPERTEQPPSQPQADGEEPRTLEQIFIPSEEIAADEEVTFPIDI
jgi:hypothetical protein